MNDDKNTSNSFPSITPNTIENKDALLEFVPLAEMVARKELKSTSSLMDFRELVNLGLIKINSLIEDSHKKGVTYKPSYIIQGVIWDIKNKNRKDSVQRGEFKSSLFSSVGDTSKGGEPKQYSLQDLQEAVIETVISLDHPDSNEVSDEKALDPAEAALRQELHKAVREAIALLPDNYREVIHMRFYKGYKSVQIAENLGVSSARITRIIQDSLALMRERFTQKKLL